MMGKKLIHKEDISELHSLENEEFSSEEVVNHGQQGFEYLEEFSPDSVVGRKKSKRVDEGPPVPFFSKKELSDLINSPVEDENIPMNFDDDDLESSLIRSEQLIDGEHDLSDIDLFGDNMAPFVEPDELKESGLIKSEDIAKLGHSLFSVEDYKPSVDDIVDNCDEQEEMKNDSDHDITPEMKTEEMIRRSFKDFIVAPKISAGKRKSFEKNLYPSESLNFSGKVVEIVDDIAIKKEELHHSSILINRDETGEIESIEVICKCGERTLIRFDYIDSHGMDNLTDVVAEDKDPIDFNDLIKNDEQVHMIDPETLLSLMAFEEHEDPDSLKEQEYLDAHRDDEE